MIEIPRDRWGRPVLPEPDGSGKERAYTRASTLSDAIDNTFDLEKWKRRQTVSGLVGRPDLIVAAQAANDDRKVLDDVVMKAMDYAGSNQGANLGTAIHAFCETVDKNGPLPRGINDRILASIEVYQKTMAPYRMRAIERFVACREVMSAGTFDRIIQAPNGQLFIADIKTGASTPKYAHAAAIQLAVYSRGTVFTMEKGWGKSLVDIGVSQNEAIMIHLPASGEPKCELFSVDISHGWIMAQVAFEVRQWWRAKPCVPLSFHM